MPSIPLPIQSYEHRSNPASTSRLQNCFIEPLPGGAKTGAALTRAPGIVSWTTVGDGPIRGMLRTYGKGYPHSSASGSNLWVVSGDKLYTVGPTGTAANRMTIGTPTQIDMAANTTDIVVVNEPDAYYHDITTTSTNGQITDTDFTALGAKLVEFLDNFLLFVAPDSDTLFGADLGSATSFDALNFATAESSPDHITGMKADHGQLLLFGEESSEVWQNTGVAGFPFQKAINGVIEQGCAAINSPAKQDQTIFWLAEDGTVRRLEGLTPMRVSTHGIEQILGGLDLNSAIGGAYSMEGHLFYALHVDARTFLYDVTTQMWHERITIDKAGWDIRFFANVYDKIIVGDYNSNRLGYLDFDTYDEFGSIQVMSWTYQPVYAEGITVFHDKLEIIMNTGHGLNTGQGSAPVIMLEYSDDGGETWTHAPDKSLGAIGRFDVRVIWSGLGSSRERVYRCSISDPIKVVVTDTILSARGGRL